MMQKITKIRRPYFVNLEYAVLFGCVLIMDFVYRSTNNLGWQHPDEWNRLLSYCFILAELYLMFNLKITRRLTDFLRRIIGCKPIILMVSLLLPLFFFLSYFPPGKWGWCPLQDDYPIVLETAKRGLQILKQGGWFGWDSSFVGGYFTAADAGLNLVPFLLPLSFLGWERALHLVALLAVLAFPLFSFYYLKARHRIDGNKAIIVLPVASLFLLYYLRTFLYRGVLGGFIGLDLVIVSLILFERLKAERRYSFFLLVLILAVLFYTHPAMFLYALVYIFVDSLFTPTRKVLKYLGYICGLLLVILSPFLIYKIKYPAYLVLDNFNYAPQAFS